MRGSSENPDEFGLPDVSEGKKRARPVLFAPGRADHNTCKYSPASLGDGLIIDPLAADFRMDFLKKVGAESGLAVQTAAPEIARLSVAHRFKS